MRLLIALAPTMYRETLAHTLQTQRPDADDEIRLADPKDLDRVASSFRPHLIVCNDNAADVHEEEVSVFSWIVIRYRDTLDASVFLCEQETRLIQDISIADLIRIVEETERLIVGDR